MQMLTFSPFPAATTPPHLLGVLCIEGTISPGLAGLCLAYALDLTRFLKQGTAMASKAESDFNSVERIVQVGGCVLCVCGGGVRGGEESWWGRRDSVGAAAAAVTPPLSHPTHRSLYNTCMNTNLPPPAPAPLPTITTTVPARAGGGGR